jgi:hypothetical protein
VSTPKGVGRVVAFGRPPATPDENPAATLTRGLGGGGLS